MHNRVRARRSTLSRGRHFHEFAQAAFVILKDYVALHEVLEFAQIAWPRIIHRGIQQVLRWTLRRFAELLAVFLKKVTEQKWNFRSALAQWGHIYRKHVQAVVKIFAESPCLHGLLNVDVS